LNYICKNKARKGYFLKQHITKMFRLKLERLMNEFGVKQEALIETINSTRVTFGKKLKDNSFSNEEIRLILDKYGKLL
jgi:hypothetical protein